MNINSTLITLKEVEENQFFFNIPIYQRLYVWEEDQIKTLLEDIETAFSDGKELFYLGGVLVVKNDTLDNGKVYDLIDGQQRFTTLWMISIIFGGDLTPFVERNEKQKSRHRVTFAIRDDIYLFFKEYINNITVKGATSQIVNALSLITKFKEQFDLEQAGKSLEIATFINEKVKLIFTEVPFQTDLNKLFEIINNRGVQLQHHEILKSQLINKIPSDERLKYSHIWDACSYMESYIEKNIRDIAKIRIQDLYENNPSKEGEEKLAKPSNLLDVINSIQNDSFSSLSLSYILNSSETYEQQTSSDIDEYEADEVRSIISFPMLLQHTLRIFLAEKEENDIPKILDKELLKIFTNSFFTPDRKDTDIKSFIELLWSVRYLFDKHIIKWVRQEDSETHLICKLEKYESKNNYYLRRRQPTTNEGEALLQSMLYHSQQITTHYWLTPYLNYLLKHNGQNGYNYLKKLDNHLFCSSVQGSLSSRTREFIINEDYETNLSTEILKIKDANDALGVAFPHYWFYKLEYILWEKFSSTKGDRWKYFKMTAKNSVEHISPQTQKTTDTNTVTEEMLNNFGNLSLVSRSINSEYSNLPFNEKKQRFVNNNRIKLDSLKMDLIYENDSWNNEIAIRHQNEMEIIINDYLELTN
ncbi:DUF262 domain-containing protein [Flavobacterium xanthum]|uniref:DUF262 domain-containing protein n=1 Tax=Flavobacterium xanthum TaxID=69322 RepID=A0A1M7JPF2_9FLAO|nr:DUF262 domain-containing protein [Flavobacterium xanthum]SHM54781.1 Protein of unknown function [Flavobacterium xanthum]